MRRCPQPGDGTHIISMGGSYVALMTAFDLGQVLVDQVGDVQAGGLSRVADGQHAADFGEGQTGRLGIADECEPRCRPGRVVAVALAGAGRLG
jgi:hypothetical protein